MKAPGDLVNWGEKLEMMAGCGDITVNFFIIYFSW